MYLSKLLIISLAKLEAPYGLLAVNNENNSMIKIRLIDSTQACLGEGANDRDHLFFAEYILTSLGLPPFLGAAAQLHLRICRKGRGRNTIRNARGLNGVQIRSRSE